MEKHLIESTATKAQSIASMTEFSIRAAIVFNDRKALYEAIEVAKQNKDLDYIVITDDKQSIIAYFNLEKAARLRADSIFSDKVSNDGTSFLVVLPVIFDGSEIGKLRLGLSLKDVYEESSKVRSSILFISIIILFMGFASIFIISTFATKKISKLVTAFNKISAMDLSSRAPVVSDDEFGKLAKAFNIMVDKLENTYMLLESANRSLETKIIELNSTEVELSRAKMEISIALDREKELSDLKSRFITIISHEYRTPLTIILLSANLIENFTLEIEQSIHERVIRQVDKIKQSVSILTSLLEKVLTIKQDLDNTLELSYEVVELSKLLRLILDDVNVLNKDSHNIIYNVNSSEVYMNTDVNQIYHILTNLLSNAIKFSPAGTNIELVLNDNSEFVTIQVIDEGYGFSVEDLNHIFEPFYKSKNTIGIVSGIGLGLTIVKRSVNMLQGQIFVNSVLNKGSNFTVRLPKKI